MSQKVLDALEAKFGDAIVATESQHGDEVALVKREKLKDIATWLRDDKAMLFDTPVFVTALDLLDWRPVKAPGTPSTDRPEWDGKSPRFEVSWQLRSLPHRHRIRIKVACLENDVKVPSLTYLWQGFGWQERETFDMYGIEFTGHEDLRRIYLYDEFVGYPLRKDYPKDKRQPLVRRPDLVGDH
jgi:NADH-quinone oxidoreductase subunit C